tara:strand:+ start:114 stop:875 length:762 start_codon:yes stop_codon:yes gene_type:complete
MLNMEDSKKMDVENKVNILLMVKDHNYSMKGKEYTKSSKAKNKSEIKDMVLQKHLNWEISKNLLYFINSIDLEKLNRLDGIERKYKKEIENLNKNIYAMKEVIKVKEINMRDTIKKEYEEKFKEQYSTEEHEKLQSHNDYLHSQNSELKKIQLEGSYKYDEKIEEEVRDAKFKNAELILQLIAYKNEIKLLKESTPKDKGGSKDYKDKYKKAKKQISMKDQEIAKHKHKILTLQQKMNESSDDEDLTSSSDDD